MAYNNPFPIGYQPTQIYYPQYQQQQINQQSQGSGIIWVQGEAGAKSYLVAPNNTVQLWDSEKQTIYLKSADASGMPSMKIIDYTIRDQRASMPSVAAPAPVGEYVSKEDFQALYGRVEALQNEINNIMANNAKMEGKPNE